MAKQSSLSSKIREYARLSTHKRVGGRSDSSLRLLRIYIKRYEESHENYNRETLVEFLGGLNLKASSVATITHTLAGYMRYLGLLTAEEMKEVQGYFRSPVKSWGYSALNVNAIETMIREALEQDMTLVSVRDAFIMLMFGALGPRVSQLIELNVDDLTHKDGVYHISFNRKKDNRRSLVGGIDVKTINDNWSIGTYSLVQLHRRYLEEREPYARDDALFVTVRGNRMSDRLCQYMIKERGKRIGLDISPHAFRRYVGTRVAKEHGITKAAIVLGHESIASTQRYVDPNVFDTRELL